MIITHCIHFKYIPNIIGFQIVFSLIQTSFKELKELDLSGNLFSKNFLKVSIYSYGYTPFYFNSFKNSPLISSDKHLRSLSDRFLANESRQKFINYMLSIKARFVLIVRAMYFSNSFGMTLTFTSNLLIS